MLRRIARPNPLFFTFLIIFFLGFASVSLAKPKFKLNNSLAKDIGQTYGFCLGQQISIKKISAKFPELAARAQHAQLEFDLVFSKSISEMESLMNEYGKEEWSKIKKDLNAQLNSVDVSNVSRQEASTFIDTVNKRTKGDIQTPVLETLLLFNPSYWHNPLQEVLDGFQKEFKTDGAGKSLGLHLGIVYPASWEAKDARAPHIVKKFVGKPLNGNIVQCMLYVNDLPAELKDALALYDRDKLLEYFTTEEVLKEGMPNVKILETGSATIAGEKTSWAKISFSQGTTMSDLYACGIIYNLMYKDQIIQIQYFVNNLENNTEQGAKEAMESYEPFFKLLAFKLYIYDKFQY